MSNFCRRDANDTPCDHTKGKLTAMAAFQNISAVIFDMDGTLVDSEIITAWAVTELCAEYGIDNVDMDCVLHQLWKATKSRALLRKDRLGERQPRLRQCSVTQLRHDFGHKRHSRN